MSRSGNKITYIKALISFEEFHHSIPKYAPAISGSKNFLLKRAKRILQNEHKKLNTMEKGIFAACIIGIGCFSFISSNANKTPLPQKQEQAKQTEKVSEQKQKSQQNEFKFADTLAPKLEFPSISSNMQSDKGKRTATIEATDSKGTKYKMIKIDDALTELYVDGKKIPENQFEAYRPAINGIEETMNISAIAAFKRAQAAHMKQELDMKKLQTEMGLLGNENQKMAYEKLLEAQQEGANMNLLQEKLGMLGSDQELYKKQLMQSQQEQEEMAMKMKLEFLQDPMMKMKSSESELTHILVEREMVQQRIKAIEEAQNQKLSSKDEANLKMEQDKLKAELAYIEEKIEASRKKMELLNAQNEYLLEKELGARNEALLKSKLNDAIDYNSKLALENAIKAQNGASMGDHKEILQSLINDLIDAKAVRDQKSLNGFSLTDKALMVNGKKQNADLHRSLMEKYHIGSGYGIYYGNVPVSGTGMFFSKEK